MVLALEFHRSAARYMAARGLAATPLAALTTLAGSLAPLRLVSREEPRCPGADWGRVRPLLAGICGSDLALLTGKASPYLSPLVSMPFIPGHEIVGELIDDLGELPAGTRVVVDPVLSCSARGLESCRWCARGQDNRCDHVTVGRVSAGLQTGYCADVGGGWSRVLVAHRHQLHAVPDALPDERAVLVEPLACAVNAVRRAAVPRGVCVVVVGAGTIGLLTVLALQDAGQAGAVVVVAKHQHQRERAIRLGATEVMEPGRVMRGLRRQTGGSLHAPARGHQFLLGGADLAFECTGTSAGLDSATRLVRAGGTVVLAGMPAGPVDLAPIWYRELHLVGAYASNGRGGDFRTALELAADAPLDGYVDGVYRLSEWRDALAHALAAGRSGSVKVAFDPTQR